MVIFFHITHRVGSHAATRDPFMCTKYQLLKILRGFCPIIAIMFPTVHTLHHTMEAIVLVPNLAGEAH